MSGIYFVMKQLIRAAVETSAFFDGSVTKHFHWIRVSCAKKEGYGYPHLVRNCDTSNAAVCVRMTVLKCYVAVLIIVHAIWIETFGHRWSHGDQK